MPVFAGDARRVFVRLDNENLGMPFKDSERGRMDVEWTEAPAQSFVLIGRQILLSEEDDEMVEQVAADFFNLLIAQRGRQIDSFEFRTNDR